MTTPVTVSSGEPQASTASASGRREHARHVQLDLGPSICASAVAALPEAMFASSRNASSCSSV